MKQIDRTTLINASFVLAGAACILVFGNLLPIRGYRFVASIATPLLCFWVGMLIRYKVGEPKRWVVAIATILMIASYGYSFYALSHFTSVSVFYQWWGIMLLGFILPWDYLYQYRDREGGKSGILLLFSVLVCCVLKLVNDRMTDIALPSPVADLGAMLAYVTLFALPFATIIPVYFAAEFSLSKAGQWLGGQKWFRLVTVIAAACSFLQIIVNLMFVPGWDVQMWQLTRLFVQPFMIYLIIVICRIIRQLRKKEMTWKEVFCI